MKKKSFLVVGLGRFGSNVAESFYKNGHDVLAIDRDYARVQQAIDNKLVNNAIKVDAIDPASLQKIDLKSFDAAVIAIGTSIEDSILAAATLKDLGIKEIVAKASNTMHGKILDKVGVNQVVYPEAEMGGRVANQLMGISYLDEFPLNENYSISEVAIPKSFANKSILDCSIRS